MGEKRKPGVGRKPVPDEKLRKLRSFKASDEEWEIIKTKAKEAGMSAGEYIRICTLQGIKE